jgi:cyanophycin synthetase
MEFRKVRALRGPNIWANFPVLEAWVDLGALNESPSDSLPGLTDRLMHWLPSLVEHRCSEGVRGGFLIRLRRGTYPAHILEHLALELQSLAGTEVGFGRTRPTCEDGVYRVVVEYEYEDLGRAALEAARRMFLAAAHGQPYHAAAELVALRELAGRLDRGPEATAVEQAARSRGVPRFWLEGGLLQLGHGTRQRRLQGTRTDRTGAVAEAVAANAGLTHMLLRAAGVPVPDEEAAKSPVDAMQHNLVVINGQVVAATRCAPGQTASDVRALLHPEVGALAVDAARAVGLDVAGVELTCRDVGQPLEAQGGAVQAVRACPGLAPHLAADPDAGRRLGDALVGLLFPDGGNGRIPVAAVTGVNGKTTTVRLLAHILGRVHGCVGMTCTEGIYIGGRRVDTGDCSGPKSARAVLRNPRVEAAVLETARGGILREGLGFDRCDVAIVTNIGEGDHLGIDGVDTTEQLARVKRTLVEVVAPSGAAVLKADDPLVAAMADHCPGSVIFFGRDEAHPVLAAHIASGGRAAFARAGLLILSVGPQEVPVVPLARVPVTHGGLVGFQVENALAAAAAAWALGVPVEQIRVGLETFIASVDQAPMRFNVMEVDGATVVLDYGHNVSSLASLLDTLAALPHTNRTAVYSAAGDRREADIVHQAQMLGDAFDRVLLYEEEKCIRGRADGEIFRLFRAGLAGRSRVQQVEEVCGAVRAVEVALQMARPGELVLVQVDRVDETVELVRRYRTAGLACREIDLREAAGLTEGLPAGPAVVARPSRRAEAMAAS